MPIQEECCKTRQLLHLTILSGIRSNEEQMHRTTPALKSRLSVLSAEVAAVDEDDDEHDARINSDADADADADGGADDMEWDGSIVGNVRGVNGNGNNDGERYGNRAGLVAPSCCR